MSSYKTSSLETILELRDIDEVLDPDIINIKDVIHNLTQINKNGLVTNIDKQGRKHKFNKRFNSTDFELLFL